MTADEFVKKVKMILDERGISYTRAGRESGCGEEFVRSMERQKSAPSFVRVQKMAQYLGMTTSELLGEEKPIPEDEDGLNVVMVRGSDGSFYERKLSDAQRTMLVQMLDNLKPADDENL